MTEDETQDATDALVAQAETAAEAIREINHRTITVAHPAPDVYRVLGNLKMLGHRLPQALTQLAAGLGRSLDQHEVYEDDGSDPVQRVAQATDHLTRAAQLSEQLGQELEAAQQALAGQGYR